MKVVRMLGILLGHETSVQKADAGCLAMLLVILVGQELRSKALLLNCILLLRLLVGRKNGSREGCFQNNGAWRLLNCILSKSWLGSFHCLAGAVCEEPRGWTLTGGLCGRKTWLGILHLLGEGCWLWKPRGSTSAADLGRPKNTWVPPQAECGMLVAKTTGLDLCRRVGLTERTRVLFPKLFNKMVFLRYQKITGKKHSIKSTFSCLS